MPTVTGSTIISSAIENVFDTSQDYSIRLKWDPYLRQAKLLDGSSEIKPGTRVYCENKKGVGITVSYVTFNRPAQTAVKMEGDFPLIKNFAGSWNFRKLNDNNTEVIFKYYYEAKGKIFNKIIEFFVGRMLRRDIQIRLTGLKRYFES